MTIDPNRVLSDAVCIECGDELVDWQPSKPSRYGRATPLLCGRCNYYEDDS